MYIYILLRRNVYVFLRGIGGGVPLDSDDDLFIWLKHIMHGLTNADSIIIMCSYIAFPETRIHVWPCVANILFHSCMQLSHEKNPGRLGYIEDYTTQLYRDYSKPV